MRGFELLGNNVHPLALGAVSRLLEETKLVALRLLSTRANPFDEEENHQIVKKISSEIYSHSHSISRTEAIKYIGLKQVKTAEDENISDELWKLYNEYKKLFEFETPFTPEEYLISQNKEEYTWENLNLACIESYEKLHVYRQDINIKRLRSIPPTVNLNLGEVNLPTINIPNLPEDIDNNQIQEIVAQIFNQVIQNYLNNAAQAAMNELLKQLPYGDFQHISLNSGWKEEV